MNSLLATLAIGSALASAAALAPSDVTLPEADLEMIHPFVDDLSELSGRAILVEFFAEW